MSTDTYYSPTRASTLAAKTRQHSLSGALSISLGLSSSIGSGGTSGGGGVGAGGGIGGVGGGFVDSNVYLGRSFVGSFKPRAPLLETDVLNDSLAVHQQTESLATDAELLSNEEEILIAEHQQDDGYDSSINETTSLLHNETAGSIYTGTGTAIGTPTADIESLVKHGPSSSSRRQLAAELRTITARRLLGYVPSVILGLLLNILDGLSYGMIIFPIGEQVFSGLGAAGLSIFYVSCIVSQLVYSLGGSAFGAGIGSEMIEVTPFFHGMALTILRDIGEDQPDRVISTTITTYAVSSIITGLVFLLMGKFKMGQLVGFFPRHILIGCIGGVGYFLVITGVEISSRLASFEYNLPYLSQFFQLDILIKVSVPILLTFALVVLQHFNHNSLILPSFFIAVFVIFHVLIIIIPSWDLESARKNGFIFSSGDSSALEEPWYGFYKLYNFKLVDWKILFQQIPSMLALTFFGVLHVPINVPALAVSTKQDDVDVDRELIAHGISNFLSGCMGSIQNYLVYTNSLLFIRAGADSRIAGIMLAFATFCILLIGPVVIGYIPVCVVGSLIFLLGYELLKEAVYDTWSKVSVAEYLTIVVIVLTMGIYDFVWGIVVGIIIASFHFLYESTQIPIVTDEFTGQVARSTVIRHPIQKQFLQRIGKQIYVLKLQSFLFFGTIGKIEKAVKRLFDEDQFMKTPVRYLILDFQNVSNIDFSAAEGLNRIKNFLFERKVFFIISIGEKDQMLTSLTNVGLFEGEDEFTNRIYVFDDLNSSLEWCENEFLTKYKQFQKAKATNPTSIGTNPLLSVSSLPINTPRNKNFIKEAQNLYKKEALLSVKANENEEDKPQEPLPLLLFAFQGLCKKDGTFWQELVPFFQKKTVSKDDLLVFDPKESFFLLVETGVLCIKYNIHETVEMHETLLPRTTLGRINDDVVRRDRYLSSIFAKKETAVWILSDGALKSLKTNKLKLYAELLLIVVKLNEERFERITGYSVVSR